MSSAVALFVPCPSGYDLVSSQRSLWLGPRDPTMCIEGNTIGRATRTPLGPATLWARRETRGVSVRVWGDGAPWVMEHVSALLGLDDRPEEFRPTDPMMRDLVRRNAGFYLPRTLRVFEGLVPTVLQQLVTFREALRAYRGMVRRFGEAAPGPGGLRVSPSPARVARLPDYALVPLGVLGRHARTLRRAAQRASALEGLVECSPVRAREALESLGGIGPWTSALTTAATHGDPDAVVLGDLHLPHDVCWALAQERDGSDARMVELLEPFAGHRWRAVMLLRRGGPRRPRRGPRLGMRPLPRA